MVSSEPSLKTITPSPRIFIYASASVQIRRPPLPLSGMTQMTGAFTLQKTSPPPRPPPCPWETTVNRENLTQSCSVLKLQRIFVSICHVNAQKTPAQKWTFEGDIGQIYFFFRRDCDFLHDAQINFVVVEDFKEHFCVVLNGKNETEEKALRMRRNNLHVYFQCGTSRLFQLRFFCLSRNAATWRLFFLH